MNPPDLSNVWTLYRVGADDSRRIAAKFLLHGNSLHVLEDHDHLDLDKLSPEKASKAIAKLADHPNYDLINLQSHIQGHHPELIPVQKDPVMAPVHSVFDYHRQGYAKPQKLVVCGNMAHLDGHLLEDEELGRVHENVKRGMAVLRHSAGPQAESVMKVEKDLAEALGHLRNAVSAGAVHPDVLRTLNRHVFVDTLVPGVGNKRAYHDLLSRPREGFWVSIDGNDHSVVNKWHGFAEGDNAIKILGGHIRSAMDESVGRKHGKLVRPGGDEFVAHVPTLAHATSFMRNLREKLEQQPKLMGNFGFSVSAGIGHTRDHAEGALMQAKAEKTASGAAKGEAKTHIAVHPESVGK